MEEKMGYDRGQTLTRNTDIIKEVVCMLLT